LNTKDRTLRLGAACLLLVAASGCRQNMHNQHKVKPLGPSTFFADGQGARPIPAHTVARGDLREGFAFTGLGPDNKPVAPGGSKELPKTGVGRDVLPLGAAGASLIAAGAAGLWWSSRRPAPQRLRG